MPLMHALLQCTNSDLRLKTGAPGSGCYQSHDIDQAIKSETAISWRATSTRRELFSIARLRSAR